MKTRAYVTILFTALLIAFSGCGGKEIKTEKKVSLTWSGYDYPAFNVRREQESKSFERLHREVFVRYNPISTGQGYAAKILTLAAGDTLPDIFVVPAGSEQDFISRGILLDLTPYVKKDRGYFSQIPSYLMDFMSYKGGIYGLPGNLGVHCLFYNRKLFDKEGLSYPNENWTWDDFLKAAVRLTKRDARGVTVQFGSVIPDYLTLLYSFGGGIWSDDRPDRCSIHRQIEWL